MSSAQTLHGSGEVLAIIPARWNSSRFPGKPVALIAGKPMIVHVWEKVLLTESVDRAVIATDDERIAAVCREYGMACEMTSPDHATGTDRISEVASRVAAGMYVNVQGDEPIIEPKAIDNVVSCLSAALGRGIEVSTGYINSSTPEQEASSAVVHLVPTVDNCVLYFSRLPGPMNFRTPFKHTVHVGLYAFTGRALNKFRHWQQGPVEQAESIELMRFLEHGDRIACTSVPSGSIGVDHPEDIARIEAILRNTNHSS
ncbi:MAG: 3-deoxy-manno-octulosonate cytidylyltransferase [Magnetococcales bacterium]|nr:3-deoxy-manno-octulosonate cytidylyltransferase [Magnetococcales bacterium]